MKKQTNKGLLGVFLKWMIPKVAKTFFSVVAKVVNKGSKVVNPRIIAIFSNHFCFSQVGEQLNKTRYHLQNPYASLSLSIYIYTHIVICIFIFAYAHTHTYVYTNIQRCEGE